MCPMTATLAFICSSPYHVHVTEIHEDGSHIESARVSRDHDLVAEMEKKYLFRDGDVEFLRDQIKKGITPPLVTVWFKA